jgi:ketosteroid isomerase-like protein
MSKNTPLPATITAFIKATNEHDGDAFIAAFAKDALVNDFSRNFRGADAIRKWSDKEMIGDKVTFDIDEVTPHYGDFMVTALTDGSYDKSKSPDPTYLDYYFSLRDGRITTLFITKNKEKSA